MVILHKKHVIMKKQNYRISEAALGRHLAKAVCLAKEGSIDPEKFLNTLIAVYESCKSEDFTPDTNADIATEAYENLRAEIEKSARRSASARSSAERRKRASLKAGSTVSETMAPGGMVAFETVEAPTDANEIPSPSELHRDSPARKKKKDRGWKRRNRH